MVDGAPVRVILIDPDPSRRRRLMDRLESDPRFRVEETGETARDALHGARLLAPDLLLVAAELPQLSGLEVVRRVARLYPAVGVVMVAREHSVDLFKQSFLLGALDYVDASQELAGLPDALMEANARRSPGAQPASVGKLWAVTGTKSAAGSSTLAVNLAVELTMRGQKVLFIDMDLENGDGGFYLDLKPREPEENLWMSLDRLPGLDEARLGPFLRSFPLGDSGAVMAVAESPARFFEITPGFRERLPLVIETFMAAHDVVVVDLPPGRYTDETFVTVMDVAEHAILVSNRDLSGLKTLVGMLKLFDQLELSRQRLTLCTSGLISQPEFDFKLHARAKDTAIGDVLEIPSDPAAAFESARTGRPQRMIAPKSPFSRFVIDLVNRKLA